MISSTGPRLSFFDAHSVPSTRTPRLAQALVHSGLCPRFKSSQQTYLFKRLVEHWLETLPASTSRADQLTIAMRYRCHKTAHYLCDQVFVSRTSPAATTATALLCASKLSRSDLRSLLAKYIDDHRTSHVWQLIASRKTKIRTQVRDVALALLLHHEKLDPREFGFIELQADELTLYRDHSLGFADESSREQAHRIARKRLGV